MEPTSSRGEHDPQKDAVDPTGAQLYSDLGVLDDGNESEKFAVQEEKLDDFKISKKERDVLDKDSSRRERSPLGTSSDRDSKDNRRKHKRDLKRAEHSGNSETESKDSRVDGARVKNRDKSSRRDRSESRRAGRKESSRKAHDRSSRKKRRRRHHSDHSDSFSSQSSQSSFSSASDAGSDSQSRRKSSRRPKLFEKRRGSFWDVKESPYGFPLPPPGFVPFRPAQAPGKDNSFSRQASGDQASSQATGTEGQAMSGMQREGFGVYGAGFGRGMDMSGYPGQNRNRQNAAGGNQRSPFPIGVAMVPNDEIDFRINDVNQETRKGRRLYVGNLPTDTNEHEIASFFNSVMVTSKGSESGDSPVLSVFLNMEKRFAFIELTTVAEAAAAICLDGLLFRGMSLRMRRPTDYHSSLSGKQEARPPASFNSAALGIVSTQVRDSSNKMFIGGIPYHLNEDQIKELLQSYGPLKAFNLIKDSNTGLSKGYAFFEFMDPAVVDPAIQGFNGMRIGDKVLTVRRAAVSQREHNAPAASSAPFQSSGAPSASPAVNGGPHAPPMSGAEANQNLPLNSNPAGESEAIGQLARLTKKSTRVLELRNMLRREDLIDDEEYQDILEDVREEAGRHGVLTEVLIPRPAPKGSAEPEPAGVGRVFLAFSEQSAAEKAYVVLGGRKFDGRPVIANYVDEEKFARREL
uniref:U2 snRNP auxiliary factor large subunit n=1 Tax=Timspurckia oligopyrenoides TaxID=708627 RepID=A0A7S0ZE67_9RHOD|mmetsp:Transcript_1837/g.3286  ORF Transcript_1837/g.3286 Transcript_1837/m.3286 type:complete len:690 (+) Transcript_1837:145-2214(+)|eukprot:CAMPEP_0182449886 /NCGR_PEP_ID=MMETSP1172-20130603/37312_1 /TAXON_ID=708627 /ORGANISM="Timspurckia oligopyrenoides, Strain CCMP3278" /LENGTH=689 /DNA_ID=CAMNT_0024647299 /DNA_START=163 /DNA_END=2232 /DNA_ORIENTATION=+